MYKFYNFPKLETSYDFSVGNGFDSEQLITCSVSLRMRVRVKQFRFCFPKFEDLLGMTWYVI